MEPQRAPQPKTPQTADKTQTKASTSSRQKRATATGVRQNRSLILIISSILFLAVAGLVFTDQANTLIKMVICGFSFAFSMGGFFSLFTGEAHISFGKWFKASGSIAVALLLLLLVLKSTGLIKADLPDLAILTSQIIFA